MTRTVGFNLIQLAFVIVFAPLYAGVLSRLKEIVQSRRGPSIFQPYRDLWKLFHKSNPVRVVFQAIFRPNITEDTRQTVSVHFRTAIRRKRDETHVIDRLFLHPVGEAMRSIARFLAGMHHGRLNAYVAYVLGFLLIVLFLYRAT